MGILKTGQVTVTKKIVVESDMDDSALDFIKYLRSLLQVWA